MFKFAVPTILLGASIAGFIFVAAPIYNDVSSQKQQIASYNEALNNSKVLESERDTLTKKYDEVDKADLSKLQKMLPDNVDNIRLILEIGEIARPYGMVLGDVTYDSTGTNSSNSGSNTSTAPASGNTVQGSNYGIWNLGFSTSGSYTNFLNFIRDLESNLRIVDVSSIDFTSNDVAPSKGNSSVKTNTQSDNYKYSFKIKTYWLRN